VLFGKAEPAGRLPVTFPASEAQLPSPEVAGRGLQPDEPFVVDYPEGPDVGYRGFARRGVQPLFPFGFGLAYTTFSYSGLAVSGTRDVSVAFEVTNTGERAGYAVPQVYLTAARGSADKRLLGWGKALLGPGEKKRFSVQVDPRLLAEFSIDANRWEIAAGTYEIAVGASADDLVARAQHNLRARTLPP
jgi:beta-glucosidase